MPALSPELALGATILSIPAALLIGLAGTRRWRWRWFFVVFVLCLLAAVLLFSEPGPRKGPSLLPTALAFGAALLVEGLVFRAAFRALGRLWASPRTSSS